MKDIWSFPKRPGSTVENTVFRQKQDQELWKYDWDKSTGWIRSFIPGAKAQGIKQ